MLDGITAMDISRMSATSYVDGMLDRTKHFFDGDALNRLMSATVAIVGVGASGSMVAELLARWGIPRFRLLDMDTYELSNINRQIFATSKTLGRWKAEVAAERIREINPHVIIESIVNDKLTLANAESFVKGATLVVNASDTRSGFYLIHNNAHRHRVPVVEGHGWKMTGLKIRVFDYRNPAQRKYNEPFRSRILNRLTAPFFDASRVDFSTVTQEFVDSMDTGKEMSGGSLGTTTTLVGCAIATEAVKLMTGRGVVVCHPLETYLDLFSLRMRTGHKNSLPNILGTVHSRRHEMWRNLTGRKR